jgi:hypothetical protein
MPKKHVVICGMSRAGTTLLHSLLLHSMAGFDFFPQEVAALTMTSHPRNLVTKRPLDCLELANIYRAMTTVDLRIIFCVRDPRSVVCSHHANVSHDYFIGYRSQYFVIPEQGICEPTNPGLQHIFAAWRLVQGSVYTLRYEDLVSSPDETQENLFRFLGTSIERKFSDFDENSKIASEMLVAMNGQRRIDTRGVNAWHSHPLRIWNEFTDNPEMFEMVRMLGYESDDEWFIRRYARRLQFALGRTSP